MAEKEIEEKQVQVADDDPVPYFRMGGQTFHSGMGSFEPGTIIPWSVPEGWREDLNGKHYAARPPSITWEPMNAAARKIHKAQLERVQQLTQPPPPPRDEKFERLMEANQKQQEQNAKLIELLTKSLLDKGDEDKKKK